MKTETLTAPVEWNLSASRASGGEYKLFGHAAVFNRRSHDLGGFVEELAPGAFRRALADPGTDALLLAEHGGLPLARQSAGTLKLSEDGTGLKVEAKLAPTTQARDIHALVQSGHMTQMSFAFIAGEDEWTRDAGAPLRRVTDVRRLFEVSVVAEPAYPQTAVAARSGVRVTGERPVYGPGSDHSYFADLLRVGESDARKKASRLDPVLRGQDPGEGSAVGNRHRGTLEDARKRLASAETRTLSTTSAANLVPKNVPDAVAEKFTTAARAAGVLPSILAAEPIPEDTGMEIQVPKLTKGATVDVDTELEAVSDTDPEAGLVKVPLAYVSGQVELSRQLLERGRPDNAIARELGAALGERVDIQILNGSGEAEQALGLLNIAGITSTTWTAATPKGSEMVKKIGENYAAVARALGYSPDTILASPTRRAWLYAQEDEQGQPLTPRLPAALAEVPAMPATLSEGGNQEAIVTLASGEVTLYLDAPTIRPVTDYAGASNLAAKILAYTSLALIVPKEQAVGKVTGTGLKAPPAVF